jgi:hypothetical protein
MEQQANNESWQVEVGGQVYDATFADLGEWIGDGALQPDDKVRRGNLRWIEARKIPGLIPFFNAKANGQPMPAVITATNAAVRVDVEPAAESAAPDTSLEASADLPTLVSSVPTPKLPLNPDFCSMHGGIPSAFLCTSCGSGFCKTCPKSYGGTVKICPMCGSMCKAAREVHEERRKQYQLANAVDEGFGINDFFNAIAHPFKFKTSLILGAIMFAFFSISQSATGIGGMVMFASAILCFMLANMMLFGVLANTVENFAQGNLQANFMPTFDDFSMWDDVVQPFFLYIAVMITSFGPFILTLIIGTYLVLSSVSSQMNAFQSEVERLPGTHYYQGRDTVEQSQEIKRVLNDTTDKHDETIGKYNEAATGNSNVAFTQPTPDEAEELWQQAQENRRKELEAAFGRTQETKDREFSAFTSNLLKLAAPLVVIGAIAFLWGCFFFPAASAVAGYTRSFAATINPLVGLDTIKRLGIDYIKILLMGLVLVIASGLVGFVLGFVLSPRNLPGMGNIVAKGFSSLFTFYLSAVFSCILGYALVKNSDKLQLLK